jgi:eukaryotic-like serine/threonine-protein kinase
VSDSLVGRTLAHYRVTARIGSGGMGEVYRAVDSRLGRDVALKVLPPELRRDAERLGRFRREARLLASLNHPNIAAIHGFEEGDGMPILALELVEGEDLAAHLASGRIPLDEALAVAKQVVEALAEAHSKGVVHRDLKPANVKLTPDGTVKVLDFGLAKACTLDAATPREDPSHSPTLSHGGDTRAGVILGTAAYMAPEQATGGDVDKRADIWALGCLLFEMLAGRRPFVGEGVSGTLAEVLKSEPDWTRLPGATPPAVRRLLRRCLAKDRRHRLADVADARLELEEAQAGEPGGGEQPRRVAWRRERFAWAAACATLLLALIGLALRGRPAPAALETRVEITTPATREPASFALSPDGEQIAYVVAGTGRSALWLRSLGSGSSRQLAGTDGATLPFWAPSGRALGFFADDGKLKRVDLDDGAVRALARARLPRGGAWTRDDTILFAPRTGPLYRVPAAGGEPTALTRLEASQSGHGFPQLLPDGSHFLYFAWGGPEVRGVYVAELATGNGRRMLDTNAPAAYAPQGYLLFAQGEALYAQRVDSVRRELSGTPFAVADRVAMGRNVAYPVPPLSVAASGRIAYRAGGSPEQRQFVWFDTTGREMEAVGAPDAAPALSASLSPDGSRVAVHRGVDGNVDIWLLELGRGALSRFTSHPANDIHPIWSPDGRRILFASNRSGAYQLFEKAIDGPAEEKLVLPMPGALEDWSRDGSVAMFDTRDDRTGDDIWALPMAGGGKPYAVVRTEFDEYGAQLSPDAKWLAYASTESGRCEVYLQPFPGPGARQPISVSGGSQLRWRPDGRALFYIGLDDQLMSVPVELPRHDGAARIGVPAPLFRTRVGGALQPEQRQPYMVSPDGGRFLMNVILERAPSSPISLILNWRPGALEPGKDVQ